MFQNLRAGDLVSISGVDPALGAWTHSAYVPHALPDETPDLSAQTYLAVADARAALGALDSTSRQLPNPTLFRLPALRAEAQSTSALEGTYAPLSAVLTADESRASTAELVEVLNYVRMANIAFERVATGHPITVGLLGELQGMLMRGTPLHADSGSVRTSQVVIGRRENADPAGFPVHMARFVPSPPGLGLESNLRDLTDWMQADHSDMIDPVVAAAMSHYQFETLHPFRDGNGRLGRFLIVLHLQRTGVLQEPTLTVSPWFEERRAEYYERLLAVSTENDWDGFIRFFARGLRASADQTRAQMLALVSVQAELKEVVHASSLRADSAHALVDFAVAHPSFNVRDVERELAVSYTRANKLVGQLVELGILEQLADVSYDRRFYAPRVLQTLTGGRAG